MGLSFAPHWLENRPALGAGPRAIWFARYAGGVLCGPLPPP